MADEFIKGLSIFTGSGLGWVVLAGWYRTPSFESTKQLVSPIGVSTSGNLFNALGIFMMDVLFWFTLVGAFTFWMAIPAAKQAATAIGARGEAN